MEHDTCSAHIEKCMDTLNTHVQDTTRHVEGVRIELQVMRENHLSHIQRATESQAQSALENERRLASMETAVVRVATNQDWLIRYHWIVATSSVGALVTAIMGLVLK